MLNHIQFEAQWSGLLLLLIVLDSFKNRIGDNNAKSTSAGSVHTVPTFVPRASYLTKWISSQRARPKKLFKVRYSCVVSSILLWVGPLFIVIKHHCNCNPLQNTFAVLGEFRRSSVCSAMSVIDNSGLFFLTMLFLFQFLREAYGTGLRVVMGTDLFYVLRFLCESDSALQCFA